ncbi:MAG: iron-sulfur cluster-binding domain-containing protein [Chloroflexi bacterium]|nr:iron-sulfur cluster-binding domain-containing protein [Chloroflexota bacterium]
MKVSVRGHLIDLLAFKGLVGRRKKRIARAPASAIPVHPVNELAQQIHPAELKLLITQVTDETRTTRSFRLAPAPGSAALPCFRAGQYLSIKAEVDGVGITRPYSISSAPYQAVGPDGFYEITLKQTRDGFLTGHAWDHWQAGAVLTSSGPAGTFYHEPLRDAAKIVGLAGGSGVTPFRATAREIVDGDLDAELLLLYGCSAEDDIPFYHELQELEARAQGRFRMVNVLSCEITALEGCEQGFITAEIIRKYADVANASFFVCGPQAMYDFVRGELAQLGLPPRRIRREAYGEIKAIAAYPGFPAEVVGQTFGARVRIGETDVEIPAQATETVLVALERAGLCPPSQCRSGECGVCRSLLVSGDVFVVPDGDGRRAADRALGYIHPCSSYPLSDLEIEVPRGAK